MFMVTLQPMKIEHLNEVFELETECFSIPWTKSSLRKEIEENNLGIYIVALAENNVVGYAGMWHIVTEGHITNIAVKKSFRRRGIGDMLVKELIRIAKEKEMLGLTLEVRETNLDAQRIYMRNGFVVEGFRKNYYHDTKEDAVIMWKYF